MCDWLKEHYREEVSERTVSRYVKQLREEYGLKKSAAPREYEAVPELPMGKQMQVDFGQKMMPNADGGQTRVYVAAFVLSRSRYKYAQEQSRPFTSVDLVRICHDCFRYMGGMPEELVFDQDSIVCVSENAGDIIYTYEFEKFRQECGLSIRMCRGADPESKGKIENVVKYIKGNFLSHRLYVDDGILNGPQLMAEIGDVTRFAHRSAITSFAGVDPGANQSGTHKAKSVRTSKSGSPELRKALFLVMDCLIQTKPQDDPVYQFMDKKRAEDKPYLVCMTAGANKFLRIHYGRVKEYLATLEGNPAPDSGERT